jgi:hypothetical protein
MAKAREKGKEIMKVVAVTVLSIGLLSASFIGVNRIALAAAVNGTETLPPITASTVAPQGVEVSADDPEATVVTPLEATEAEIAVFESPVLTLFESPYQHYHAIPAYALSMEDAAEIGARNIWDVFGESIDGMYVQMSFTAHASLSRTMWFGMVSPNGETASQPESRISPFMQESIYNFSIDGITGERINLSQSSNVHSPFENFEDTMAARRAFSENSMVFRYALLETGWFDMTLDERMDFLGVTSDALEVYAQKAREFGKRHFNLTTVVDVRLDDSSPYWSPVTAFAGNVDEDGNVADFFHSSTRFLVTDDTGREAVISIPAYAADWLFRGVDISTQHNDFIPGFNYDRPGGIG